MPAAIRNRDREIGRREPVLVRYERICFEKESITVAGKPLAAFICPGHPFLNAVIDLILERYRDLLKRGAIFVNETDQTSDIKALFYLEHSIQDASIDKRGLQKVVSRQMQFVEIDQQGKVRNAGYAPYLDYRPLRDEEKSLVASVLEKEWKNVDLESMAVSYAITHLVHNHFHEVKNRTEEAINRTINAVKDRLIKEINYWDHRAEELRAQELAGRENARINSAKARARADELQARLARRLGELEKGRQMSPLPPVVIGGAIVIPAGLIEKLGGYAKADAKTFARETIEVEEAAMQAVMAMERDLGYNPRDVSKEKCGYDIESALPEGGKLRFIEVKGRIEGAETVTITKNEILTALNKPEDYLLAIVEVPSTEKIMEQQADKCAVRYVLTPFNKEPDFGVTSVNYSIRDLLKRAVPMR